MHAPLVWLTDPTIGPAPACRITTLPRPFGRETVASRKLGGRGEQGLVAVARQKARRRGAVKGGNGPSNLVLDNLRLGL